jgi:hypothetical protein
MNVCNPSCRRDFFRYFFLFLFGVLSVVLLKRKGDFIVTDNCCKECLYEKECLDKSNDPEMCQNRLSR